MSNAAQVKRSFSEAVRLQLDLYRLFQLGHPNSAEADEVRGELEHHWWQLNESEQSLLEGLSADLNNLNAERQLAEDSPAADQTDQFRHAVETNDWKCVLDLTRDNESQLSRSAAANIRGVAWMHLGFPSAALEFFQEMARLGPLKPLQEIWLITSQIMAGRVLDAVPRALEIAAHEQDPLLMMNAANVLSIAADRTDSNREMRKIAINLAIRSLELLKHVDSQKLDPASQEILRNEKSTTLLRLAYDLALDGQFQHAQTLCQDILVLDPNNLEASLLLGWLVRDQNQQHASKLFFGGFSGRLSSVEAMRLPPIQEHGFSLISN